MQGVSLDFVIEDLPEVFKSVKISADQIFEISRSLRNFSRKDELTVQPTNLHEGLESTFQYHSSVSLNPCLDAMTCS